VRIKFGCIDLGTYGFWGHCLQIDHQLRKLKLAEDCFRTPQNEHWTMFRPRVGTKNGRSRNSWERHHSTVGDLSFRQNPPLFQSRGSNWLRYLSHNNLANNISKVDIYMNPNGLEIVLEVRILMKWSGFFCIFLSNAPTARSSEPPPSCLVETFALPQGQATVPMHDIYSKPHLSNLRLFSKAVQHLTTASWLGIHELDT